MKAIQTVTATAGLAAVGLAWWKGRSQQQAREADKRSLQEAVETFEGEGGLVLN